MPPRRIQGWAGGRGHEPGPRLALDGITVHDPAPATVSGTDMIPDAAFLEGAPGDVRNIPVGRLGMPQEVATVVTTLCRTGYLTGQSIVLAGGLK